MGASALLVPHYIQVYTLDSSLWAHPQGLKHNRKWAAPNQALELAHSFHGVVWWGVEPKTKRVTLGEALHVYTWAVGRRNLLNNSYARAPQQILKHAYHRKLALLRSTEPTDFYNSHVKEAGGKNCGNFLDLHSIVELVKKFHIWRY